MIRSFARLAAGRAHLARPSTATTRLLSTSSAPTLGGKKLHPSLVPLAAGFMIGTVITSVSQWSAARQKHEQQQQQEEKAAGPGNDDELPQILSDDDGAGAEKSDPAAGAAGAAGAAEKSGWDSAAHSAVEIIAKKRDGGELSSAEISWLVEGYNKGEIPDYQMSAFAMAVFLQDMNDREVADLTSAMTASGFEADLSDIPGFKVDKHSTGGVGDKVSLILAPLIASFDGLVVPMMSGRALGHTGGTLDKLEAIPGYKSSIDFKRFKEILSTVGVAIIGPTSDVAPADKKLYALRDVTATVASQPLICASIMSKKLAEGCQALVLDVKFGRGAFIREPESSEALARSMIKAGEAKGRTVALMTSMDQPLGCTVGNWLETREAFETLDGRGPADLVELVIAEAALMLLVSGKADSVAKGAVMAREHLQNGLARDKFFEMVRAQGGNPDVFENPAAHGYGENSVVAHPFFAEQDGFVSGIDSREVGLTSVAMGAGRQKVTDEIDYAAGFVFERKIGDAVKAGDVLFTAYTNRAMSPALRSRITKLVDISAERVAPPPLITKFIDGKKEHAWPPAK